MGATPAHSFSQIDAPDLAAFDSDPRFLGCLRQRIERPLGRALLVSGHHGPIGLRLQVPRRRLLDEGENPAALPFRQPGLASRSWPHPQASDPFEREALQMDADRLRMAIQLGRDLVGRLACPAQEHHLGVTFPISGRVMASSQPTHLALFLRILRRSRFHLLGHLSAPLFGWFSSLYFSTIEERSKIAPVLEWSPIVTRKSVVMTMGRRVCGCRGCR